MTTAIHRFRKAAAALSLFGVLSITACAPVATNASTTTASTSTSSASTTASTTSSTSTQSTPSETTAETITDTAAAAQVFLATLSEEQREQVLYSYDDEARTTSWSNFPVTFVERAGLNLTDLSEEQQTAALAVLEGLLSEEGYTTVTGIMGGDQFLLENSTSTEDSLGQYYIAFFGNPSDTTAWQVQFGGHHLGINATLNPDPPLLLQVVGVA